MITPFREERLDETRLREQIEFQITSGIDGLVPVGTTGESPTLDFAEHKRVIELTIEHARRRVPVIAGSAATRRAKRWSFMSSRAPPARPPRFPSTRITTVRRRRDFTGIS
jgi:dihydrodipicolinate synthase/N-acetylneuraminate lyase